MIRAAHRHLSLAALATPLLTAAATAQPATEPAPAPPAPVADAPPAEGLAPVLGDVENALKNGKLKLSIRARLGYADFDNGTNDGFAPTIRTRLGWETGEVSGFKGFFEFEDVQSFFNDDYNSTQNGNTGNAVIADVEGTEVNQAWVNYNSEEKGILDAKIGRQVIILDDQRFIGDVGWRQDQQTFDAARFTSTLGVDGLNATAGYIGQVNRIFGEEADFDSESFFVNVGYKLDSGPTITGFVYGLDFDSSPINSSITAGGRITGKHALSEGNGSVVYAASVAAQTDFGDNPVSYDALYYTVDLAWASPESGTFGAGYEVLGSDDGDFGFQTPLATLHKFNGFADVFLVTPTGGLADAYAYWAPKFPKEWGIKGKLAAHVFNTDDSNDYLGWELDAVVTKKLTQNITVLGKVAYFEGSGDDDPFDRTRVTLDLNYSF